MMRGNAMMLHHRHVILTAVCLAACCATVSAQNMLGNGEFDTDVSGWTPYGVLFEWDSADCHQSPSSGSGRANNNHDGTMHASVLTCVDGVVGGQSYDLGGMLRIPTGQVGGGFAYFGLYWYDGVGCVGTQTWVGGTPFVTTSNIWTPHAKWGLIAPVGTQSAWVGIFNNKTSPGTDPFVSYHDGIYFGVYGGIFADGFESGATNIWFSTQD